MSGIAGIFSRTGQPVKLHELQPLTALLRHRGPDGADAWLDGSAGLVHCLLHTTPESLHERQPYSENGLCITADARIDNRAELARLLGIETRDLPVLTDCQLILAAYQKWGVDCPKMLLGDFAFAIWDARQQTFFCARDHLGVKPFYYWLARDWFIFASEIKGILHWPQAPRRLNETWMADFLLQEFDNTDKTSTFYEEILRLPPAHALSISATRQSLTQYWALDPEREIRLGSDEEYGEALREQFTRAVERRLRSAFPVGSTLSGGLDSSSIACVARDLLNRAGKPPLHTFSAFFQDAPDADESEYINAVLDQGGVIPHILHPDRTSPFIDLEQVLRHNDEPFTMFNYFMPWASYQCARASGVRVLMDGTDGDTTISHGMDLFDLLARRRDWPRFIEEAQAVTRNFDHPVYAKLTGILYGYGAPHLARMVRQGQWVQFGRDIQQLNRLTGIPARWLAANLGIKPAFPAPALRAWRRLRGRPVRQEEPDIVAPEFRQRLKATGYTPPRPLSSNGLVQKGRAMHAHFLQMAMLPTSLEGIGRLGAANQLEMRFPFCDRELLEFSLAVPPEQKLNHGWSRYIMRNAMTGILPEPVQWRGGKISLGQVYPYMMRRYAREYVENILSDPQGVIRRYFNLPVLQEQYHRFLDRTNPAAPHGVWVAVVLSVWMKEVSSL